MSGPGLAVADDVEAVAGAGDGDVEDVGGSCDPFAGFFAVLEGAEHEDDHVGLTTLKGVDRAAFDAAAALKILLTDPGDGAKGRDDEDLAFMGE